MDIGTAIIGAISIAIFASPFAITGLGRKKKEKKLMQALSNLAKQHNGTIHQHDFSGEFVIGIDETANYIYFFKNMKDKEVAHAINLASIQNCKVINKSSTINNKGHNYKVTELLELSLAALDKSKPDILLEFYNADENYQINDELQLIEKWSKIINDRLKLNKK